MAKETDSEGRRIIAVKGKRYVISSSTRETFAAYWSERNGERFGATRFARGSQKPGTVGRAILDAVNR